MQKKSKNSGDCGEINQTPTDASSRTTRKSTHPGHFLISNPSNFFMDNFSDLNNQLRSAGAFSAVDGCFSAPFLNRLPPAEIALGDSLYK